MQAFYTPLNPPDNSGQALSREETGKIPSREACSYGRTKGACSVFSSINL